MKYITLGCDENSGADGWLSLVPKMMPEAGGLSGPETPLFLPLKGEMVRFPCGEWEFSLLEEIAGQRVVVMQKFSVGSFGDDLMKLRIVCDVLNRNGVGEMVYFAPFLPYSRQDKTYGGRSSLGFGVVADLINACNFDSVITYDLHAPQSEVLFNCPVKSLSMVAPFLEDAKARFGDDFVLVFPDFGAAARFGKLLPDVLPNFDPARICVINKSRFKGGLNGEPDSGSANGLAGSMGSMGSAGSTGLAMEIMGQVGNAKAVIIDDMVDSGGTVVEAAGLLLQKGASGVVVYATHGVLSGRAVEKISKSALEKVYVSDSVAGDFMVDQFGGKLQILPIR